MSISTKTILITLSTVLMLGGCGSEGAFDSSTPTKTSPTITPPTKTLSAFNLTSISPSMADKSTVFTWDASDNATEYSLCQKDVSKPKSCDEIATSQTTRATVHGLGVIKNLTSEYFVMAKNSTGEVASNERSLTPQELTPLIQYIKASNTGEDDFFGDSVALSLDGYTLAVGVSNEDSSGQGVNTSAQADDSSSNAGAVYIFRYIASTWAQEAYIKASNTDSGDGFGGSIALSSDGNTLAVGARNEDSSGQGVNTGAQSDDSSSNAGAVYLFRYNASTWAQEAYIKASNTDSGDDFGGSIALSPDGNTLAVGARNEDSSGQGVNTGAQADDSSSNAGAVYLFRYSASTWAQEAYIKASNTDSGDNFGGSIALSSDGNTLAVGAYAEGSSGQGVNTGAQADDSSSSAGAVYLFRYSASTWAQEAYIKASNTDSGDNFGGSIALSSDGNTLAVGAYAEGSSGQGINTGAQADNNSPYSGAVYLFRYSASTWAQEAYIKASNTGRDYFGYSVALSSDGNTLAVGAAVEDSNEQGVNTGAQADDSSPGAGAVYLFRYNASTWDQEAYLKASNTDANDNFGFSFSLSSDGNRLAVGARGEDSSGQGVNTDTQLDDSQLNSGAVYVY
ncbi:conserved exported hypothetical protein [Vibrio chagasii]|nr:conserved exported hypothetical protein [Vibrio chagasii]CAH6941709.1 conserved exported hypothetical protein [Vibrio chagasii]CAH7296695.1 conserved exported hypothetical protein [Vibrio chagasii]